MNASSIAASLISFTPFSSPSIPRVTIFKPWSFRSSKSHLAIVNIPNKRMTMTVVHSGPPSTNTLIFAFVFPLSLLVVTIFTSIRIADKLDQQYLEESAALQAMAEEEDDESEMTPLDDEEFILPRSRNRPRRESSL